jgi:hypothetical protein
VSARKFRQKKHRHREERRFKFSGTETLDAAKTAGNQTEGEVDRQFNEKSYESS